MSLHLSVLGEAALQYAKTFGWAVFPCWWSETGRCVCGSEKCKAAKHPLGILVPHGHREATTDVAVVEGWWKRFPKANIGLPAIKFAVLDEDPRGGGDGTRSELEAAYGELPESPRAQTGGGGRHYFFEPVAGLTNWQKRPDLPGIDFRAG